MVLLCWEIPRATLGLLKVQGLTLEMGSVLIFFEVQKGKAYRIVPEFLVLVL